MTAKDTIAAFIKEMRANHADDLEGIDLPEGTPEYLEERMQQGDTDTLIFMLKLGYLMGLQTGFAAGQAGSESPAREGTPWGPLEA